MYFYVGDTFILHYNDETCVHVLFHKVARDGEIVDLWFHYGVKP